MENQTNEIQGALEILGYQRKKAPMGGGYTEESWCRMRCRGNEFKIAGCRGEFEMRTSETRKLKDCGCGGWEAVKLQRRINRKEQRLAAQGKLPGIGVLEARRPGPGRPAIPVAMKKSPVMFYLRNQTTEKLQKIARDGGSNMSALAGAIFEEWLAASEEAGSGGNQ